MSCFVGHPVYTPVLLVLHVCLLILYSFSPGSILLFAWFYTPVLLVLYFCSPGFILLFSQFYTPVLLDLYSCSPSAILLFSWFHIPVLLVLCPCFPSAILLFSWFYISVLLFLYPVLLVLYFCSPVHLILYSCSPNISAYIRVFVYQYTNPGDLKVFQGEAVMEYKSLGIPLHQPLYPFIPMQSYLVSLYLHFLYRVIYFILYYTLPTFNTK